MQGKERGLNMGNENNDGMNNTENGGAVFNDRYGANPKFDTGERAGQPVMDPSAYTKYNTDSQITGETYAQPTYDPNQPQTFNPTYNTPTYENPLEIQPNRHLQGFIGALIGAIIGGAVWMGIGCLGFISGWIAILIFFLAQFFYKKFNKSLDTFGVIVCIIMGLVIIFPATWGVYTYKVAQALDYELWDVATDLPFYLKSEVLWVNGQQWTSFLMDLGKSYLFTVIAAFCLLPGRRK